MHAERSQQRTPTHLANELSSGGVVTSLLVGAPDPLAATLLTKKEMTQTANTSSTVAVGSVLSGGTVSVASGNNTTITGSTLVADGDIRVHAGNDLTIQSAQNTASQSLSNTYHASGNVGTPIKPSVGHASSSGQDRQDTTTQVASQVASLNGNVNLSAGNQYTQTASDVLALATGADGRAGNIAITAKNVVIDEAYDTTTSLSHSQGNQTAVGGSLNIPLVNAVKGIANTVHAAGQTSDSRMQALAGATVALQGYQAYQDVATGNIGVKVSAALTHSNSQSASVETESTAVGSNVAGAGNVSIRAIGGGAASNLTVTSSEISGRNVSLDADNAITLQSAQDTHGSFATQSGASQSVGVGFGVGAQTGISIEAGASHLGGHSAGNGTTQVNTHVTGSDSVSLNSGGDTTIKGAVVQGEQVSAHVGGSLNIQSLQDTNVAANNQSSAGFNVSVCVPPICYGVPVTGSASAAGAQGNGNYQSVTEQSGIKTGDGGFNVAVAGNTNLAGGVIASTDAAVNGGKNSFSSGGGLTSSNITNTDGSNANAYSASAGYGGTPAGGLGVGQTSGSQVSTTHSGISGYGDNPSVRTGSSANSLTQGWNASTLTQDAQAQATIINGLTQQFLATMMAPSGKAPVPNAADPTPAATQILLSDQETRAQLNQLQNDSSLSGSEQLFFQDLAGAYGNVAVLQNLVQQAQNDPVGYQQSVTPQGDTVVGSSDDGMQPVVLPLVQGTTAQAGAAASFAIAAAGAGIAYNPQTDTYTSASGGSVAGSLIRALGSAADATIDAVAAGIKQAFPLATAFAAVLTSTVSGGNGGGDGSSSDSGSTGGNLADTYGVPPNGASPPPEDDSNQRGVGGRGWRGDRNWRAAVSEVSSGGTIEDINGVIPSRDEAVALLRDARAQILRIEGPHEAPNPHSYAHINYVTANGIRGTIRIAGL